MLSLLPKIKPYWFVIFYFINFFSFSQSPVFKNFTIKDGLPSNESYDIFQDSRGFIWICTDAGLVKYDANKFRTFSSVDGLPDNTVFEVKEDKKRRIWYRTFSGSIGYVLNDSVYTIPANEAIMEFQKTGLICSFAIDEMQNVYLGRQSKEDVGFIKISPPYSLKDISYDFNEKAKSSWMQVLLLPGGDYVYSECRGSNKFGKEYPIAFIDPQHNVILSDTIRSAQLVSALTRLDRSGDNFIFSGTHLVKEFSLKDKKIKTATYENPIINVCYRKNGGYFISYRDKGIEAYQSEWNNSKSSYLNTISNSSIMEDNNDGIWYSTLKNGIFYSKNQDYKAVDVSQNTSKSILQLKPLSDNRASVILEDDGLYIYELNEGKMTLLLDVNKALGEEQSCRNLYELKNGNLLLSYYQLQVICDYEKLISGKHAKIFTSPNVYIHAANYKNSVLLYSFVKGCVYDSVNGIFKNNFESNDRLNCFAYNSKTGEAYFGGLHGLYKFYDQPIINETDKIASFRVKHMEFLDKRLFIATKGFGLIIKDGSLWDTIGVKDGLIGNVCEKIIIDGDRCWVSSNKGLSCVTYSGFKKYDIVNYHLKDLGTPSLIQDYFIKDSVLYFASGCMVYTYPLKEQRLHPVPFYVYKLEVNGKMVPIKNNLEFGYEESNIRVHFGALYYNLSGVVKYRYKLLPNDAAWTYTTESSVLFPSLSPGSYSLLLQAQRNDGSWIECKDVVNFSIQKPFWLQWWCLSLFVVLGVSMVTGISYFFYSRKLRRELIQTKIRTRLYSLEMRAVKAQMNPHFIFNSLNSIQHFILAEENENAYKYLSKFSKLVRKLIESNQSENLMLETEVEILTKYLEIESMRFKDAFTYEVKVDPSINRMKKIPHMMIQPFVENAIWHGLLNKKGERSLIIHFSQLSENSIECRIEDNGIGINKAKESIKGNVKEKSLALDFIQERLMLFSRTMGFSFKLSVRDKSDIDPSQTGTEVLITLPLM